MKSRIQRFTLTPIVMLIAYSCLLFASGCARYAHSVTTLYEPSATTRGGTGEVYIVIPENRQTRSPDSKWVLGTVKDFDRNVIDELFSPRSPAEIIQEALGRELKKAGYTVIPVTKRPDGGLRVIDLTKAEIDLEQISDYAGLKAKCRLLAGMDVFRNGQPIKRIQYESTSTKSGITDRDMLAGIVLEDALKSVMLEVMPELHTLFTPV